MQKLAQHLVILHPVHNMPRALTEPCSLSSPTGCPGATPCQKPTGLRGGAWAMDTFLRMGHLLELSIQVDLQNAAEAKLAASMPAPGPALALGPTMVQPALASAQMVEVKKEASDKPQVRDHPTEPKKKKKKLQRPAAATLNQAVLPPAVTALATPTPSKAACPVSFARPACKSQGGWKASHTAPALGGISYRRKEEKWPQPSWASA